LDTEFLRLDSEFLRLDTEFLRLDGEFRSMGSKFLDLVTEYLCLDAANRYCDTASRCLDRRTRPYAKEYPRLDATFWLIFDVLRCREGWMDCLGGIVSHWWSAFCVKKWQHRRSLVGCCFSMVVFLKIWLVALRLALNLGLKIMLLR